MTKITFITNAFYKGQDIAAGKTGEVPDDDAKGFIERGTARPADEEVDFITEQYLAGMQPNSVDQAAVNSGNVEVVTQPTPEQIADDVEAQQA